MDRYEIDNGDIYLDEIVHRIQDNVRLRKNSKVQEQKEDDFDLENASLPSDVHIGVEYINSNWNIENNNYHINSHRRFTGNILVKGRNLVHGEVRRYVDPLIASQSKINATTASILKNISSRMDIIETDIDKINANLKNNIGNLQRDCIEYRQLELERLLSGGERVLCIECGNWTLWHHSKSNENPFKNIEEKAVLIGSCRLNKLDVEMIDAVNYLEEVVDSNIDFIMIGWMYEDLKLNYMIELLNLCYKKLTSCGHLIARTVSPSAFCSTAGAHFNVSYRRLLHPETIRYLFQETGFKDAEINRLSNTTKGILLKETESEDIEGCCTNKHNPINAPLGSQDFVVIGKK